MASKRIPPTTPAVTSPQPSETTSGRAARHDARLKIGDIVHYDSEPDLRIAEQSKKRKLDSEESNVAITIKQSFEALSKKQDQQFAELKSIVCSVKDQNNELTKTVELLSQKNDDFIKRIQQLEKEKSEDKKTILQLEDRLEKTEKWSRSSGIEIRNIPKMDQKPESKNDLCEIVKLLGKTLNMDIGTTDIRDIYRTHSTDSLQRPVIVEFTSTLLKENLLNAVKTFNKNKTKVDKLNTSHLNYKQPIKPIYVSELLTQKIQRLFFNARNFQKNAGFKFCWTSRGSVYLRKDENMPQVRIDCEADLVHLRMQV